MYVLGSGSSGHKADAITRGAVLGGNRAEGIVGRIGLDQEHVTGLARSDVDVALLHANVIIQKDPKALDAKDTLNECKVQTALAKEVASLL